MSQIVSCSCFIEALKQFSDEATFIVYTENFSKITIDEKSDDGAGEIYLDISGYGSNFFFIKLVHTSAQNIGMCKRHNDGIVFKINLEKHEIEIFLFELKKTLRFNKLEKASKQLLNAYKFTKYLMLDQCFTINYKLIIASASNNLHQDAVTIKTMSPYQQNLFSSVYEKKSTIPIMLPFCTYENFSFQYAEFNQTIDI